MDGGDGTHDPKTHGLAVDATCKVNRGAPAGLPIEQVLGEYSLSLPS